MTAATIITTIYCMLIMYQQSSEHYLHCHPVLTKTYEMGAIIPSQQIKKLSHRE